MNRHLSFTLLSLTLALSASCSRHVETTSERFLRESWEQYKSLYVQPDGSVLDRTRNGGETTSEGQGYALLRAVWLRDERIFERVYRWTEMHLRRPDGLYSWRWTPQNGGRVLDPNSASDADQEVAFALTMAGTAFRNAAYVARARELLLAIRTHESLRMPRGSFPAAGNWAVADRLVNLSYFLPYAYPYFARVDPAGGWDAAVDAGYGLIAGVHSLPGVRLAPDFITVDADGHPTLSPSGNAPTVGFTSDSVRTYWRTALDCQMHARPRACADPLHAMQLQELIARDGALFTLYDLDGTPRERTTSLSFYGAAFPYLLLHAPALGRALREGPLSAPSLTWMATDARRYYDANWVWFGLAAGEGLIARWTPSIDSVGH